jgi:hypothetical protein
VNDLVPHRLEMTWCRIYINVLVPPMQEWIPGDARDSSGLLVLTRKTTEGETAQSMMWDDFTSRRLQGYALPVSVGALDAMKHVKSRAVKKNNTWNPELNFEFREVR